MAHFGESFVALTVLAGLGIFGLQILHGRHGLLELRRRRRPVHNAFKRQFHDRLNTLRFLLQIGRQLAGEIVNHFIMQQEQWLLNHGGIDASNAVRIHRRQVKGLQQRHHVFPPLLDVHAAPPSAFARFAGHITALAHLHLVGLATLPWIQPAGNGDQAIVQFLRIETPHGHTGKQIILGIQARGRFGFQ